MHSFYLPPGNLDRISVTGPDAVKLLQGQLTCDVAAIPDPGFARGALCNNKGRVLATFILVREGAAFHLVLNKGLGEIAALAIKKFLPFYKCELGRIDADDACFGICGEADIAALGLTEGPPPSGECRALEDGWICNLDQAQRQFLLHTRKTLQPQAGAITATISDWLACGVRSGQFPFGVEDVERYTPQELHLDRHGYVSFTKGCYTGQEIVARMHYRGKLKKLLFLLEAKSGEALPNTMEVLDTDDHLLGSTLKVLESASGLYALAPLPAELETRLSDPVKNPAGLQFSLRVF